VSGPIVRRFVTPGSVHVRAHLSSPDVEVETWAAEETEVELVARHGASSASEAMGATRVEHRVLADGRHEVVVEQPRRHVFGFARDPDFVVRVRCPHGTAVEVGAASSDVRCRGDLGGLIAKTASGNVVAEGVRGRTVVEAASGDVELGTCGELEAKLVSGDLTVGEARGRLTVTTVSGDVRVRAFSGAEARIQAVSGDLALDVVPGRRVFFDVSSVSGTTASTLDPVEGQRLAAEAATIEIRARTVSGDVHVGRAVLRR
jgi:hypothetical protein